jgi:hypothetical protein
MLLVLVAILSSAPMRTSLPESCIGEIKFHCPFCCSNSKVGCFARCMRMLLIAPEWNAVNRFLAGGGWVGLNRAIRASAVSNTTRPQFSQARPFIFFQGTAARGACPSLGVMHKICRSSLQITITATPALAADSGQSLSPSAALGIDSVEGAPLRYVTTIAHDTLTSCC